MVILSFAMFSIMASPNTYHGFMPFDLLQRGPEILKIAWGR